MLWEMIRKDFPQLYWRSRNSNIINSWLVFIEGIKISIEKGFVKFVISQYLLSLINLSIIICDEVPAYYSLPSQHYFIRGPGNPCKVTVFSISVTGIFSVQKAAGQMGSGQCSGMEQSATRQPPCS